MRGEGLSTGVLSEGKTISRKEEREARESVLRKKDESFLKGSEHRGERKGSSVRARAKEGLMGDALEPIGEEGRSKLRKASGSCKRAKNRGCPNGVT